MTSAFRKERRRLLASDRIDIDYEKLRAIVESTRDNVLADEQRETLRAAVDTLARVQHEMANGANIRDIRRFFGWTSEKTRNVLGGKRAHGTDADEGQSDDVRKDDAEPKKDEKEKKKRTTGRRSTDEYIAAEVVKVPHEGLKHKDPCPDERCDGKVYRLSQWAKVLRVTGVAPLKATRYDLERLRCNLCGTVYTAGAPDECGDHKYDETVPAMVGTLRYGKGFPHNRIEKLSGNLGVPFPASTQWDVINSAADALMPVFDQLVLEAAQRQVFTIDDTTIKVIEINAKLAKAYRAIEVQVEAGELPKSALKKQRTGVHTTGMVAEGESGVNDIVLFLTGERHAGENFQDVFKRRAAELEPPIRMADGLAHNFIGDAETHDANCLVHGRRQFVKVSGSFPDEVEHVLKLIGRVYKHDNETKKTSMSPAERLAYHQVHSQPVMDELHRWLRRQIDERLVEPNSSLGGAIAYLDDHWEALTLFLRVAGAPLDSNVVERVLKLAIQHRKNSLFYRSQRGAQVGDCFMTLIHTAERGGVNAFEYLVSLLRNAELVADSPAEWMPWNYAETMKRLGLNLDPSG